MRIAVPDVATGAWLRARQDHDDPVREKGYSRDGGPATSAQLSPQGVAVDGQGNVCVVDYYDGRVRKVSDAGRSRRLPAPAIRLFRGRRPGDLGAAAPRRGGGGRAGERLRRRTPELSRVRKVSPGGTITTIAGPGTAAGFR